MSTKTLFLTLMGTALFAAPACAQDTTVIEPETMIATVETDYTSSDLDQDGLLSKDEFVTFAVMRSEAGDSDYTELVSEGAYDVHFAAKDANADAALDRTEVGAEDVAPLSEMTETDESETETPEIY